MTVRRPGRNRADAVTFSGRPHRRMQEERVPSTPLPISRINHVGITTTDLDASVAWYVEHLGCERLYEYDLPGGRAAFVRLGEFRIEFF
jgi:methylmalonyl-CoA/ethylmalonyl-CoA epimerase